MDSVSGARRVIVLDTETTGLDAAARIVELAAIEVDPRSGRLGRRLHYLLDPQVPIPAVVTRIHGIGDSDVAGKPRFWAIADELCAFLRGATLAIQNAAFDRRMLDGELRRAGRPSLESLQAQPVDTVAISRGLFPLAAGHRLDDLCDRFGIDRGLRRHHGALVDVRLLAQTLRHLATAYDAWLESRNADQLPELLHVQADVRGLCDALTGEMSTPGPEDLDRTFARVAAVDLWFARRLRDLAGRLADATPPEGWAVRELSGRWVAAKSIAWKAAALEHLTPSDLSAYQWEARANYLSALPHEDAELDAALATLARELDAHLDRATPAQTAQNYATMRELAAPVSTGRSLLRTALLNEAASGFTLRYARLDVRVAVHTHYRDAMAVLAPSADLTRFTTSYDRLSLRPRDLSSCAVLFGERQPEISASSPRRVA
jgi:DNA polymerase III subunit epsilon